ncbi:hypothetical protein BDZ45DRAFT_735973 [Acephala macrosclerotiorum]|nr:hypothetical protein BDZ45DRAFT_735973 [Acephala macrosclerotiorum]
MSGGAGIKHFEERYKEYLRFLCRFADKRWSTTLEERYNFDELAEFVNYHWGWVDGDERRATGAMIRHEISKFSVSYERAIEEIKGKKKWLNFNPKMDHNAYDEATIQWAIDTYLKGWLKPHFCGIALIFDLIERSIADFVKRFPALGLM